MHDEFATPSSCVPAGMGKRANCPPLENWKVDSHCSVLTNHLTVLKCTKSTDFNVKTLIFSGYSTMLGRGYTAPKFRPQLFGASCIAFRDSGISLRTFAFWSSPIILALLQNVLLVHMALMQWDQRAPCCRLYILYFCSLYCNRNCLKQEGMWAQWPSRYMTCNFKIALIYWDFLTLISDTSLIVVATD